MDEFLFYAYNRPDPRKDRGAGASYLRHLDSIGEMLGARLNTIHNLHFYFTFMDNIRSAIANGSLSSFSRDFRSQQT